MRVLVTGATGFIGSALVATLAEAGHSVTGLTRRTEGLPSHFRIWDPQDPRTLQEALKGHEAVIHLAGENIAARRWNPPQKERLFKSRVESTAHLSETLAGLAMPPNVLLCASAVGYYGAQAGEVDESSPPGSDFLASLCVAWENAALSARASGIRVVHMRFGVVLHPGGGLLSKMLPLFRWGLGGILGDGRHYLSWISLWDLARAVRHLLASEIRGPVNMTSPRAVTNREWTRGLAAHVHRPAFFSVPSFALRAVYGEMAEALLLSNQRARPVKLEKSGFLFEKPSLEQALSG